MPNFPVISYTITSICPYLFKGKNIDTKTSKESNRKKKQKQYYTNVGYFISENAKDNKHTHTAAAAITVNYVKMTIIAQYLLLLKWMKMANKSRSRGIGSGQKQNIYRTKNNHKTIFNDNCHLLFERFHFTCRSVIHARFVGFYFIFIFCAENAI